MIELIWQPTIFDFRYWWVGMRCLQLSHLCSWCGLTNRYIGCLGCICTQAVALARAFDFFAVGGAHLCALCWSKWILNSCCWIFGGKLKESLFGLWGLTCSTFFVWLRVPGLKFVFLFWKRLGFCRSWSQIHLLFYSF